MQGYIKLHRKIQDHWIYQEKRKFSKYEAWIDMLMMANHKDNKFALGNELVEVERGSFITSEKKLMERWDWGKAKTRNFLEMLEKDDMITKKSDRKKTSITIHHYCDYHDSHTTDRPQADHDQTENRLQSDTNKNVKNVKNDKVRQKFKFEPSDMSFAELLFDLIQDNGDKANQIKEPNLDRWANDIRLMRERDGRTFEQIEYVIKWTQDHHFWKQNILSGEKLRKHYDQIVRQIKSEKDDKKELKPKKPKKPKEQLEQEKMMAEARERMKNQK